MFDSRNLGVGLFSNARGIPLRLGCCVDFSISETEKSFYGNSGQEIADGGNLSSLSVQISEQPDLWKPCFQVI
jgi:hypothetical protein